jgi:hypothetical protein
MDRVDEWAAGAEVGEGVDSLHGPPMGGLVERVDPVADLVDDVDLPLARRHSLSVPIAKPGRRRVPRCRRRAGSSPARGKVRRSERHSAAGRVANCMLEPHRLQGRCRGVATSRARPTHRRPDHGGPGSPAGRDGTPAVRARVQDDATTRRCHPRDPRRRATPVRVAAVRGPAVHHLGRHRLVIATVNLLHPYETSPSMA